MRVAVTLTGLLALGAFALVLAPASVSGQGVVGQSQTDAAIVPLDVDAAVVPINIDDSIQELQVQRTRGSTTTVTLSSDVLFAFDRAALTTTARHTIDRLAGRLRHRAAGIIHVDGYTDSIGGTGYNLGLSRRRARSVARALHVALAGRRAPHILASGHGEAHPVAPNSKAGHDNPAGRAKNRRVVISFRRR